MRTKDGMGGTGPVMLEVLFAIPVGV